MKAKEKEREKRKRRGNGKEKKKRNEFPRRSNGIKQVAEFHNRRYDNHAQRTGHGVIFARGTHQHIEFPYTRYRVARRVARKERTAPITVLGSWKKRTNGIMV